MFEELQHRLEALENIQAVKTWEKALSKAEQATRAEAKADYQAEKARNAKLDKKYARLNEPDEEGVDMHPADPIRRFIDVSKGKIFRKADPLTEEEKAEAEVMWEAMTCGNYTLKRRNNQGKTNSARGKLSLKTTHTLKADSRGGI